MIHNIYNVNKTKTPTLKDMFIPPWLCCHVFTITQFTTKNFRILCFKTYEIKLPWRTVNRINCIFHFSKYREIAKILMIHNISFEIWNRIWFLYNKFQQVIKLFSRITVFLLNSTRFTFMNMDIFMAIFLTLTGILAHLCKNLNV